MKKDCIIPNCGALSNAGSRRILVGAKQLKKAILGGTARQVFLAQDADPAITEPLESLCKQYGVPYSYVRSKQDLGRSCHIEVGAAAAAIAD